MTERPVILATAPLRGPGLETLRSLGLRRIGHSVRLNDGEATRGMVHAVRHLVEVKEGK